MKLERNNNILNLFKEIYSHAGNLAILTGSLALIILKEINERECADLDIVLPYYIDLTKFGEVKRITNYNNENVVCEISGKICKIHVVVDPKCIYHQTTDAELNIKISNSVDIWIEKFKSFLLFNVEKNKNDIQEMFKLIEERKIISDIPF